MYLKLFSSVFKKELVFLASPKLSFLWNLGSFLGILFFFQILSGILLVFFYSTSEKEAFFILEQGTRNSLYMYLRVFHLNQVSVIFLFFLIHMSRGLLLKSTSNKIIWFLGWLIFVLSMLVAFMGYVLPWGQMSFWAATVITKFVGVLPFIGEDILYWVWSGFYINFLTLKTLFCLHFLLPLFLFVLMGLHILFLHLKGSTSTSGTLTLSSKKVQFSPGLFSKDALNFVVLALFFIALHNLWWSGESENFIEANFSKSPVHIKPEWYFLFAYGILRSVPHKLSGVLLMVVGVIIFLLPSNLTFSFKQSNFSLFYLFCVVFFVISWVGANPVSPLFVFLGQMFTFLYFLIFFLFLMI